MTSRAARIALAILPILFGAALLAAWLLPAQLDWNRYRAGIAELASARLGQKVTIDGPVTLTLLPQPELTAGQVSVGDPATDALSIRVQALRLRVAPLPLLAGRIDARELVLRGPDLHIPWPTQPNMLPVRPPAWLAAFAARVENGRLTVGEFAVTGIDGRLSSLETGTLDAAGAASIAGQRWRVTARLSSTGADGTAGLNVTLEGQGKAAGSGASFTGQFAADGRLAGSVTASGPDLSLLLPAPAVQFSAEGRLTIAGGRAEADELALQLAGAPATGAVALRMLPQPRLDIAVSATRLDLDPWLPPLLAETAAPPRLPVGLDLSAEAASLAGATVQHLRVAFDLTRDAVTLREGAGRFPGDADLVLTGRILRGSQPDAPFEGDATLHAPQLRTTLRWLTLSGLNTGALPPNVLQQASLRSHVEFRSGRLALTKLAGRLDDTKIAGSLAWRAGEPPAIAADLTLDRLTLSAWLPPSLDAWRSLRAGFGRLDSGIRLRVGQAAIGAGTVHGLVLDAATAAGGVNLRRLEGSVLGAHVVASGVLGQGGRLTDASLQVTTQDATPLADLLPVAWQATPALWHAPASLEIKAGGPPNAIATAVSLTLGDLRLQAQPTFDVGAETAGGPLTLRHPNARRLIAELGLPARLSSAGVPLELGEGSLSLVTRASITPGPKLALENADLGAGGLRARLQLALDDSGAIPSVTGQIAAETVSLLSPGDAPLPFKLLRGWRAALQLQAAQLQADGTTVLSDAGAALQLDKGHLRLDSLTGRIGGGTLSGSLALDAGATPPTLELQGRLTDATITASPSGLPIGLQSGVVNGQASLTAAGYSAAAMLASLQGSVQGTVQDGAMSGFDLAQLRDALRSEAGADETATIRQAIEQGETGFQQLTLQATVAQGILSFTQAELSGPAGGAQGSGSIALPTAAVDLRVELRPALPDAPDIAFRLNGPIASPRRTPELAGLARWRAGHIR